jgi:hypothetical protein
VAVVHQVLCRRKSERDVTRARTKESRATAGQRALASTPLQVSANPEGGKDSKTNRELLPSEGERRATRRRSTTTSKGFTDFVGASCTRHDSGGAKAATTRDASPAASLALQLVPRITTDWSALRVLPPSYLRQSSGPLAQDQLQGGQPPPPVRRVVHRHSSLPSGGFSGGNINVATHGRPIRQPRSVLLTKDRATEVRALLTQSDHGSRGKKVHANRVDSHDEAQVQSRFVTAPLQRRASNSYSNLSRAEEAVRNRKTRIGGGHDQVDSCSPWSSFLTNGQPKPNSSTRSHHGCHHKPSPIYGTRNRDDVASEVQSRFLHVGVRPRRSRSYDNLSSANGDVSIPEPQNRVFSSS